MFIRFLMAGIVSMYKDSIAVDYLSAEVYVSLGIASSCQNRAPSLIFRVLFLVMFKFSSVFPFFLDCVRHVFRFSLSHFLTCVSLSLRSHAHLRPQFEPDAPCFFRQRLVQLKRPFCCFWRAREDVRKECAPTGRDDWRNSETFNEHFPR